jgi:hypothetical protein
MSYSIFHLFVELAEGRGRLASKTALGRFPFEQCQFAYRGDGKFPDMVLRVNADRREFNGGEIIELKDAASSSIASFNSTVPTGRKQLSELDSAQAIRTADPLADALPERDVYYLVRTHRGVRARVKISLVHGNFFETIPKRKLIPLAFNQVVDEHLALSGASVDETARQKLVEQLTDERIFSKSRHVAGASIKPRFRVMSEVEPSGNPHNSQFYPEIVNATLNFIAPIHHALTASHYLERITQAAQERGWRSSRQAALVTLTKDSETTALKVKQLRHRHNGAFVVLQMPLA